MDRTQRVANCEICNGIQNLYLTLENQQVTKSNTAVAAIAMLGVGIYAPQTLAHNNCQSQARSAQAQSSASSLVINQPGVTLDGTGSGTSAQTTSETLILSGQNQETSNAAQITYIYGSNPAEYFNFPSNQSQITWPIAIQSFDNNLLNVTNTTNPPPGVPITVNLNGATCSDGLYLGLSQTLELANGGIAYNCNTAGRLRTLSLTSQDNNFKTLFIYGVDGKPIGEPFVLGLNCTTDGSGVACTDVGQDYDLAIPNNQQPLNLNSMSDVTIIHMTATQNAVPVDVYMYPLTGKRADLVNCTCTCPR